MFGVLDLVRPLPAIMVSMARLDPFAPGSMWTACVQALFVAARNGKDRPPVHSGVFLHPRPHQRHVGVGTEIRHCKTLGETL